MKDRSCLTNLTSSCGKVTLQVNEEEAVNVVSLDISKGFDTVELSSFPCVQFKQMLCRLNTILVSARGPELFPASFHIWGCGHGLQGSAESSHTSLDL